MSAKCGDAAQHSQHYFRDKTTRKIARCAGGWGLGEPVPLAEVPRCGVYRVHPPHSWNTFARGQVDCAGVGEAPLGPDQWRVTIVNHFGALEPRVVRAATLAQLADKLASLPEPAWFQPKGAH